MWLRSGPSLCLAVSSGLGIHGSDLFSPQVILCHFLVILGCFAGSDVAKEIDIVVRWFQHIGADQAGNRVLIAKGKTGYRVQSHFG